MPPHDGPRCDNMLRTVQENMLSHNLFAFPPLYILNYMYLCLHFSFCLFVFFNKYHIAVKHIKFLVYSIVSQFC